MMRRLVLPILICCLTVPALAQQERDWIPNRDGVFKNAVVLVVDADPAIRDQVTESLEKSFSLLGGAEVMIFDSSWTGKSDWVISVSVSLVSDKEDERTFQMGFAFSEAVNVVEADTLLALTKQSNVITFRTLKSEVDKSSRGISDFRAMWITLGEFPTDIDARCIEAAKVFDKTLLDPVRRRWNRSRANNVRNSQGRQTRG